MKSLYFRKPGHPASLSFYRCAVCREHKPMPMHQEAGTSVVVGLQVLGIVCTGECAAAMREAVSKMIGELPEVDENGVHPLPCSAELYDAAQLAASQGDEVGASRLLAEANAVHQVELGEIESDSEKLADHMGVCQEDAAICDCEFHTNARRAASTHDDDDDDETPASQLLPPGMSLTGALAFSILQRVIEERGEVLDSAMAEADAMGPQARSSSELRRLVLREIASRVRRYRNTLKGQELNPESRARYAGSMHALENFRDFVESIDAPALPTAVDEIANAMIKEAERPRVRMKVDLCDDCAGKLRAIEAEKGQDAAAEAAGGILNGCQKCRRQLTPEMRERPFRTQMKRDN